ncbi:MAG TPA: sulfite exporter TauE/SafE family protein [Haliangiales bacterium]|nr:sulfite exporter TauE/SafE family protein [Haliangiales bacterium]
MDLTISVDGHAVLWPGIVLLGLAVGYLAGMFGVGGGFIVTPLLSAVFGVPLQVAAGTSLAQMVGTALVAFLRHQKVKQGEPRFDLLMLAGSVLGVDAGTRAVGALAAAGSARIAGRSIPWIHIILDPLYIAFLVTAAVMFWWHGEERREPGPLARVRWLAVDLPRVGFRASAPLIAYVGFGLGFLSGLLGVGGGVALLPVLVFGFGFPFRQAAGTGILVVLTTAIVGTIVHALEGNVHLGLAMMLLVGSSISAQLGAVATKKAPIDRLTKVFVVVVGATIVAVGWSCVRQLR